MTEQEAIKNVKTYIFSEFENMPIDVVESLKMAVKALERQEKVNTILNTTVINEHPYFTKYNAIARSMCE